MPSFRAPKVQITLPSTLTIAGCSSNRRVIPIQITTTINGSLMSGNPSNEMVEHFEIYLLLDCYFMTDIVTFWSISQAVKIFLDSKEISFKTWPNSNFYNKSLFLMHQRHVVSGVHGNLPVHENLSLRHTGKRPVIAAGQLSPRVVVWRNL